MRRFNIWRTLGLFLAFGIAGTGTAGSSANRKDSVRRGACPGLADSHSATHAEEWLAHCALGRSRGADCVFVRDI